MAARYRRAAADRLRSENGRGPGHYTPSRAQMLARIGKPGRNGLHVAVMAHFKQHRGEVQHVSEVFSALFPGMREPRKSVVYSAVGRAMAALQRTGQLQRGDDDVKNGKYVLPG